MGTVNEISSRILKLLKEKDMTIYELSKKTGLYEASLRNSLKLESGFRGAATIYKIAKALDTNTDYLISGIKSDNDKIIDENKEIQKMKTDLKNVRDELKEKNEQLKNIRKAIAVK